jgi:hypothetical protein
MTGHVAWQSESRERPLTRLGYTLEGVYIGREPYRIGAGPYVIGTRPYVIGAAQQVLRRPGSR